MIVHRSVSVDSLPRSSGSVANVFRDGRCRVRIRDRLHRRHARRLKMVIVCAVTPEESLIPTSPMTENENSRVSA